MLDGAADNMGRRPVGQRAVENSGGWRSA
jgi:hypothetical protein